MTKPSAEQHEASGAPPAALRWRLRAGTERTHQTLDERLAALPLETFEGYRTFLSVVAPPTFALENALDRAGVAELLPDWPSRKRSNAILADLDALGVWFESDVDAPTIVGEGQIWGTLYVLEGARLGGAVLRRRISASGDHRVRTANRYLSHGDGERHWATFLTYLESSEASLVNMQAGAQNAFALFHQAADRVLLGKEWRSRQGSNLQPAD